MAWISIYDSIDCPKLKDLYKRLKCSKFEATGILVYLWQWGLNNADISGLLKNADKDDIERCLYSAGKNCELDFHEVVDALIETGWIEDRDGSYYLHDWSVWQKNWYSYKERNRRDMERKRASYVPVSKRVGQEPEIPAPIPIPIPVKTETTVPEKKPASRPKISYSEEFERFWSAYPRHDRKGEAFKNFMTRMKEGFSPDQMIGAAERYTEKCIRLHTKEQYMLQPTTFLGSNLRFTEYLSEEPKKQEYNENLGNPFEYFAEG